jgi:oligosaccharyltransferase complex subunit alpha (ribophorin I)
MPRRRCQELRRRDTTQEAAHVHHTINTTLRLLHPPDRTCDWVPRLLPNMRSLNLFASCLAAVSSFASAELNHSKPLQSKQLLPSSFAPPQVFKNNNLVRTINLDKAYPRETVNIIIENIDAQPQSEYYLPFETSLISKIGGFEVRDKKNADLGIFKVEVVGFDAER